MEENQNVNANPPKKKKGKAKKIVIALIVLLVVAIGVVAVLGFTGKLDFNFTKKSKADAGIEKLGDVVSQTVTDFETEYNEAGLKPKIYENEEFDFKNMELTTKMSINVNEFEFEDMSSEDENILEMVNDIFNKTEFEMKVKTGEEQGSIKLGATLDDEPISLEVAYDGEKLGVRSEELNEKWIAVELERIIDEIASEIDFDEEAITKLVELNEEYMKLLEDVMLTDEEIEHFKSTYSNILTDYILSLDIESEKDTIEVGDKEKKCTKTTITLTEEDIKDLLITCVEKVENDDEGQEIVKEKINTVMDFFIENAEIFDSMDTYSTPNYDYDDYDYYDNYYTNNYSIADEIKDAKKMINELFASENFDMIKDEIEEIDLEGLEIIVESYSSLAEVYATDITFEVDGNAIIISMVFDENATNVTIGMKSSGMSMDMIEIILLNEKNHKSFEVKTAKDAEAYMGTILLKGDAEFAKNKMILTFDFNVGEEGSFTLEEEINVKTNTDTAYQTAGKVNLKADIADVGILDITYNIESEVKIANIDFASIDEYIDITEGIIEGEPDEKTITELKQYIIDAVPGVVNVLEAVKKFKVVELEGLEENIDKGIDMLESLSIEDFETITEEMPVETNPAIEIESEYGTGTVIY